MEIAGHPIFHWHLELSSKCALKCPRCPRTERPGQFKVTEMTLDFIQKLFPPSRLSSVKKILMSGGQGDPVYCRDFLKIIRYFKESRPEIQLTVTTNGSYKKESFWREAAGILQKNDTVIFSVDGWDQKSNELYRRGSDFQSVMEGIKTLRRENSGLFIVWSAIVFKFNQDRLDEMRDRAEAVGASAFNIVQSSLFGSANPAYIDPALGFDPLEPDKKFIDSGSTNRGCYITFAGRKTARAVSNAVKAPVLALSERYRDLYQNSFIKPLCRLGERGLYADAEGILYPCSWISHPFRRRVSLSRDKAVEWEESLFVRHKDCFNLHKRSLEEILGGFWWKKLSNSFLDPEKAFVECERHCRPEESAKRLKRLQLKKFFSKGQAPAVKEAVQSYSRSLSASP